jgi:hypothetical protein
LQQTSLSPGCGLTSAVIHSHLAFSHVSLPDVCAAVLKEKGSAISWIYDITRAALCFLDYDSNHVPLVVSTGPTSWLAPLPWCWIRGFPQCRQSQRLISPFALSSILPGHCHLKELEGATGIIPHLLAVRWRISAAPTSQNKHLLHHSFTRQPNSPRTHLGSDITDPDSTSRNPG